MKKLQTANLIKSMTLSSLVATTFVASHILSGAKAHATLIGDTVTVENIFDDSPFDGPTDVVVGTGIELFNFGNIWDIDIGASSILLSNPSADLELGDQDEYLFTDLDWVDFPAGKIIGASLSTSGFFNIAPTVSFGDNYVHVFFAKGTKLDSTAAQEVWVNLDVEHVPEPLTILGSFAALGFGALLKKKKLSSKIQ